MPFEGDAAAAAALITLDSSLHNDRDTRGSQANDLIPHIQKLQKQIVELNSIIPRAFHMMTTFQGNNQNQLLMLLLQMQHEQQMHAQYQVFVQQQACQYQQQQTEFWKQVLKEQKKQQQQKKQGQQRSVVLQQSQQQEQQQNNTNIARTKANSAIATELRKTITKVDATILGPTVPPIVQQQQDNTNNAGTLGLRITPTTRKDVTMLWTGTQKNSSTTKTTVLTPVQHTQQSQNSSIEGLAAAGDLQVIEPFIPTTLPKTLVGLVAEHFDNHLDKYMRSNKSQWQNKVRMAYSKRKYLYEYIYEKSLTVVDGNNKSRAEGNDFRARMMDIASIIDREERKDMTLNQFKDVIFQKSSNRKKRRSSGQQLQLSLQQRANAIVAMMKEKYMKEITAKR